MIIGKQVRAYRNLNNGKIGLRDMKNKLVGYCDSLVLSNCKPLVGKGQQATIKRKFQEGIKDKQVHAFIIGTIVSIDSDVSQFKGEQVSYNPYFDNYFYYSSNKSKEYFGSNYVAFKSAPKGERMLSIAFN